MNKKERQKRRQALQGRRGAVPEPRPPHSRPLERGRFASSLRRGPLFDTTDPPNATARFPRANRVRTRRTMTQSEQEHTNELPGTAGAPARTVCVTGATGFIGAQLAARLADGGHRVRVTFRDRGRLEALAGLDVDAVEADALDR